MPAAMSDLFSASTSLEQISIIDGELAFAHQFYSSEVAKELYASLLAETPWRQDLITVWGKTYLQPRLTAWYGDVASSYNYSGIALAPQPWTATLLKIKTEIEALTMYRYNSVLLNLYRDQQDSVGWHSDNELELGHKPAIASVSFGESRIFKLRHKSKPEQKTRNIELSSGSVLFMAGSLQQHWEHAVLKETRLHHPRINLTFRKIQK